jgi:hypothetical protein
MQLCECCGWPVVSCQCEWLSVDEFLGPKPIGKQLSFEFEQEVA